MARTLVRSLIKALVINPPGKATAAIKVAKASAATGRKYENFAATSAAHVLVGLQRLFSTGSEVADWLKDVLAADPDLACSRITAELKDKLCTKLESLKADYSLANRRNFHREMNIFARLYHPTAAAVEDGNAVDDGGGDEKEGK